MEPNLANVVRREDAEQIHRAALRVLEDTGVQVESEELLRLLSEFGGSADFDAQRVRFPEAKVEQFIQECEKYDWSQHRPRAGAYAGIYESRYLNPETGETEPFTEDTLRDYIRLGNALEEIGGVGLLGLPFVPDDIPAPYLALAEKVYAWKHHAAPSGTVQFTGLCPYIVEMYERRAEEKGEKLEAVFGATGYLISPLRLARAECEQVLAFRARGLRMGVGHMLSLGGSTPITIAGAAVLSLAETLFLAMLRGALWGDRRLGVGGFGVVLDMRSIHSMGGRPEAAMVSAVLGQVARFYGVASWGNGGLTDAKEPSPQAAAQKAMAMVASVFTNGSSTMDVGLLSLDEILSPEQMLYDVEVVSAVRRMVRPVEVNAETCAVEEIAEVGPGGNFVGTDLTASRFREELWEPRIWDRQALQDWLKSGGRRERDRVKERIRALLAEPAPEVGLSPECERDLRAIIARAVAAGAAS